MNYKINDYIQFDNDCGQLSNLKYHEKYDILKNVTSQQNAWTTINRGTITEIDNNFLTFEDDGRKAIVSLIDLELFKPYYPSDAKGNPIEKGDKVAFSDAEGNIIIGICEGYINKFRASEIPVKFGSLEFPFDYTTYTEKAKTRTNHFPSKRLIIEKKS